MEEGLVDFDIMPTQAMFPGMEGTADFFTLADRFIVPPFSVLDARQGYWQDRKRAWLSLGIQSELGRGENIVPNGHERPPESDGVWRRASPGGSPRASLGPDGHTIRGDGKGRGLARCFGQDLMWGEHIVGEKAAAFESQGRLSALQLGKHRTALKLSESLMELADGLDERHISGTSIFDPVLCELVYRWFCPPGGKILDPFAGGSVRGIVASCLGYDYTGIELRPEQVEANEAQAGDICKAHPPAWVQGDAMEVLGGLGGLAEGQYDVLFSCPPYHNLEVYSDLQGELSAMPTYETFLAAYRAIIVKAMAVLKHHRFACFVVGNIRDKTGCYHDFVGDTVAAFRAAGARLYNEAVLLTAIGSLPLRAPLAFESSRKLGKAHQNVLVFVKGDPKRATEDIKGKP